MFEELASDQTTTNGGGFVLRRLLVLRLRLRLRLRLAAVAANQIRDTGRVVVEGGRAAEPVQGP